MAKSIKEIIKQRRSVRSFRDEALPEEELQALRTYIASVPNPFDVPVPFRMLDVREHGLSSPVIMGADTYVAAKVKRGPRCELGYGYSFEKFCLYALSRGIGTVMLALSIDRPAFEEAMDLQADEIMPVASPVGYPAEQADLEESMRKGLKAD